MKIKLDENLDSLQVANWLQMAGYVVSTVREQSLTSAPDTQLIEICTAEESCLPYPFRS